MTNIVGRYMRWLHTGWPAGTVEKLPESGVDGATAVPGVRITGDLGGIPLLKFSADTGARAVAAFLREEDFTRRKGRDPAVVDVAIIGGGVSGIAAAMEAKKQGLRIAVYEAAEVFNTIANFPKGKPIYTYPTEMVPAGEMQFGASVKETLLEELASQRAAAGVEVTRAHVDHVERKGDELIVHLTREGSKTEEQVRALRVIVAIGRSGNYRKLGAPGETLDKVYQRLYDPKEYSGQSALVVGGGDSALETAIALTLAGAKVTLSYRNAELARPKSENVEKLKALLGDSGADVQMEHPSSERVTAAMTSHLESAGSKTAARGSLELRLGTRVKEIAADRVVLDDKSGASVTLPNDVVLAMIGREAPLDFFRRSGIPIRGEWRTSTWAGFIAFFLACVFVYNWKAGTELNALFQQRHWFPFNLFGATGALGQSGFGKTLAVSLRQPGFYYSLAYTVCVILFGLKRVREKRTPYIKWQTAALASVQLVPLFLLPYFVLPMLGSMGAFDGGFAKTVADNLFPPCNYDYGREYWRAFGLVLAWPLFFWNVFSSKPMTWWLVISGLQTFVLIPAIVRFWGKGAYCGWICSCGALAETLGDAHRQKMPHGPIWNRLNMVGQVVLAAATLLFVARAISWYSPDSVVGKPAAAFYNALFYSHSIYDYYHVVDMFLAGIVGVGLYFWFSGRVWCRFACPLAALMHIYARFSVFRIFADKKKCISCNVCTSVCHQGIDVMSFANKGLPMQDPECVRCSACVQSCPTGTLSFGHVLANGQPSYDRLGASLVQMSEGKRHLPVIH